eukprot:CAMPEP_0176284020 /NCGR_PEP_ID=MMETSP0121_2-20121125/51626_1 /TAXON_ID=160619 /ORGANISM="Kryptoperidinium foliaceum, Strain CCMP 1326" /LENGTH=48 /DNA_ID= /DNA_START= /DNA_END= /DNA_ORIENTATION=
MAVLLNRDLHHVSPTRGGSHQPREPTRPSAEETCTYTCNMERGSRRSA